MKKYEEMGSIEFDVLREIGSIGTGHAATALSQVLNRKIEMTLPQVEFLEYNDAINKLGGPESMVAGVLVAMSGDISGIMLYLQRLDFINLVLEKYLAEKITDYNQLNEMAMSAAVEVGNIMISSYISAVSRLADVSINLSVPALSVNMLGAILSVPMIEYGHQTDKIMTVDGKFVCDNQAVYSHLLMVPEVNSLNYLLGKLGVHNE